MKSEKIRTCKVISTLVIGLVALAVIIVLSILAINQQIEDASSFLAPAFSAVCFTTLMILLGIHCVSEKQE